MGSIVRSVTMLTRRRYMWVRAQATTKSTRRRKAPAATSRARRQEDFAGRRFSGTRACMCARRHLDVVNGVMGKGGLEDSTIFRTISTDIAPNASGQMTTICVEEFGQVGLCSAEIGANSTDVGRHLPIFVVHSVGPGPTLAQIGNTWAGFHQICPNLARVWPTSIEFALNSAVEIAPYMDEIQAEVGRPA